MTQRPVRWLVLCFAVAWFGVLVPVHNRGQIAMPGSPRHAAGHACHRDAAQSASPAHACHSAPVHTDCRHGHGSSAPEEGRDPESCAVCFFVAGLHTPPPVTTVEQFHGYAGTAPVAHPAAPESARLALPFHSRAPPAA